MKGLARGLVLKQMHKVTRRYLFFSAQCYQAHCLDVFSEDEMRQNKKALGLSHVCLSQVTGLASYRSSWDFKTGSDVKIT